MAPLGEVQGPLRSGTQGMTEQDGSLCEVWLLELWPLRPLVPASADAGCRLDVDAGFEYPAEQPAHEFTAVSGASRPGQTRLAIALSPST